jgi:predicted transposase YbfD/YdcC
VKTYNALTGINLNKWTGLRTIIQVERKIEFIKNKKETQTETAYFISSLPITTKAKIFNQGIRSHWSIENSLHYVKDKTFQEDNSKIISDNAPANLSLIRSIALNVFRKNGHENIAEAVRLISNDIFKIWEMLA